MKHQRPWNWFISRDREWGDWFSLNRKVDCIFWRGHAMHVSRIQCIAWVDWQMSIECNKFPFSVPGRANQIRKFEFMQTTSPTYLLNNIWLCISHQFRVSIIVMIVYWTWTRYWEWVVPFHPSNRMKWFSIGTSAINEALRQQRNRSVDWRRRRSRNEMKILPPSARIKCLTLFSIFRPSINESVDRGVARLSRLCLCVIVRCLVRW